MQHHTPHHPMVPEVLACGEVRYPYRDADGALLFEVVRHLPKRFEVVNPDNRVLPDGVIPRYILYRLPELLAADPGETVWYVEGEKDCDRLHREGLVATTNPGGARHGWQRQYAEPLSGRHVVVLPDADGPGRRLAAAVRDGLRGAARSCVVVELPGLTGGADVSDWLERQGNVPRLHDLAARARYAHAGVSVGRGGAAADKRGLVYRSGLATLSKLALLALYEHSRHDGAARQDVCRLTAGELGRLCSCHRVTAQRILTDLRTAGVLRSAGKDWAIAWDVVAVLGPPAPGKDAMTALG